MLLTSKSICESLLLVIKDGLDGTVLLVTISVHCCEKNVLKILALDKKSVTNSPFQNRGEIDGTFIPFTKLFNIVQ